MRNLLLSLAILIGVLNIHQASAAVAMGCGAGGDDAVDSHVLFKGEADFQCASLKFDMKESETGLAVKRRFNIHMSGVGLGLYGALAEGFALTCPTVRSRAMGRIKFKNRRGVEKNGVTDFYGLKVEAGAIMSVQAGLVSNKNGGVCILTGVGAAALGAAAEGIKMTINECEMAYNASTYSEYCRDIESGIPRFKSEVQH